jgi:hypothetical protein
MELLRAFWLKSIRYLAFIAWLKPKLPTFWTNAYLVSPIGGPPPKL